MTYTDDFNLRNKHLVKLSDIADAIDGLVEIKTWTPSSYITSSAATWTSVTATGIYYLELGKLVFVTGMFSGTLSGDVEALYIIGLPVPAHQSSGDFWPLTVQALLGGPGYVGAGSIQMTNNRVSAVKYDRSNFTAGTGRGCLIQGWYRAA